MKKHLLGAGLILILCFLSFGQTLEMYFWADIYTLLYKLLHPLEQTGVYGTGILGRDGPYRWTAAFLLPFYPIFGLESNGYYFVGIILYFLASLAVYFFAKTLTDNKKVSFAASLIFASGYVGSNSLYELDDSYHNIASVILLSLTAANYYKFVKTKRTFFYLLSFALYLITTEIAFIRAHGIILLILGIEFLFNFKLSWPRLLRSILRITPFLTSYWYNYVYSAKAYISVTGNTGSLSLFQNFYRSIFVDRNLHFLLTPLQTIENIFIPDKFQFPLFLFVILMLVLLIWKRSRVLYYSLIFVVSNVIIYFLYWPQGSQHTTHRYLNTSFAGAAIFLSIAIHTILGKKSKLLFFPLIALVVMTYLILGRAEQTSLIQGVSLPSRQFWQALKKEVQQIPKNSAVYFDLKEDGVSSPAYDNAVVAGALPADVSFAVHYGLSLKDIYRPETFPELINLVKDKKVDTSNIYTFFYSRESGLVNTTESTKKALFSPPSMLYIESLSKIDTPATSPSLLEFLSNTSIDFSETKYSKSNDDILSKYLPYLLSKHKYYNDVSVSASSEFKYAEVKNIKDQNKETSWRAAKSSSNENNPEEVSIDLKYIRKIGAVKLSLESLKREPTKYKYYCSIDGILWEEIKNLNSKKLTRSVNLDKFESSNCKSLKLSIFDTTTHDSPQIAEMEVIESDFSNLDFELADKIEEDPFAFVHSQDDQKLLQDYFNTNGIDGKVCIYTDKYKPQEPNCKNYNLKRGISNNSLLIDQGGTTLQKVEFKVPPQIKINTKNITLKPLTFNQLKEEEYR